MAMEQTDIEPDSRAWWLTEAPPPPPKQTLRGIRFEMLYRIDEQVRLLCTGEVYGHESLPFLQRSMKASQPIFVQGWSVHDSSAQRRTYSQVSVKELGDYLNRSHGPNKTFIDRILEGHESPASVAGEPNVFISSAYETTWASFFAMVQKSMARLVSSAREPKALYLWTQHLCLPQGTDSSPKEWLTVILPGLIRSVDSVALLVGSMDTLLGLRDLACLWDLFLCITCGSEKKLDVVFDDADETLLDRYECFVDMVCHTVKLADATANEKAQLLEIQAAFADCGYAWQELELLLCQAVRFACLQARFVFGCTLQTPLRWFGRCLKRSLRGPRLQWSHRF